jgi:integrase
MVAPDCSEIELPGEITKTGEPLTLPLAGKLAEIATTLKKLFRDESKPVFDSRDLRYCWYEACAKAGFGVYDSKKRIYRGLTLHDMRRSAARNLIRAGASETVAMSITGHKTSSIFKRYNITDTNDRKDALIKVGQYSARQVKQAAKG